MISKTIIKSTKQSVLRSFAQIVSPEEAVSHIQPGDTVLSGGFGVCGDPNTLIKHMVEKNIGDLTIVSDSAGIETYGVGLLLNKGLVRKMIASYIGANLEFQRQYLEGEIELEITPQGSLAEKIRSGGKGIPAFWTPTGAGTIVETGGFPVKYARGGKLEEKVSKPKETRVLNGNFKKISPIFSQNLTRIRKNPPP